MQFKDVLVDQAVKEHLLQQVRNGRVSHAQFFLCRPGGHGFALAVALAQYLFCEHPTENDSCGECPSCKQIAKIEHPDLHIYFPNCTTKTVKDKPECKFFHKEFNEYAISHNFFLDANEWFEVLEGENKQPSINVRDTGSIIAQNSIKAYMGGYKVYIIWCADRIYHEAAPRLLKTLEEPEGKSLFILLSDQPDKILQTIMSRTQLVVVPPMSNEMIEQQLMKEYPDLTSEMAHKIALHSENNYVKARNSYPSDEQYDNMLSIFHKFMVSAAYLSRKQPLDKVDYADITKIIEMISKLSREEQKQHLLYWMDLSRRFLSTKANEQFIDRMSEAEQKSFAILKNLFTLKFVSQLNNILDTAILHITRNANASLVYTDLYFQIATLLAPAKK